MRDPHRYFPRDEDWGAAVHSLDAKAATAEDAVASLIEENGGLRACAILGLESEVLAESSAGDWSTIASRIWAAADDESRPPATQVHVGSEAGEVYAVRGSAGSALAVADRFTLASLMFCDLRAALRRLELTDS